MRKYFFYVVVILILIFTTGCKKTIIGKWKSNDSKDKLIYIFNNDNTCSYEMSAARLDCTYEIEKDKLIIMYNGGNKVRTFEFRFENNMLIIKDETGKDNKFIKLKEA